METQQITIGRKHQMTNTVQDNTEMGAAAAKLTAVWAGTLFGIQLSDLVLLATLIYTLLQICIIVWEKLIKPWRASKPVSSVNKPQEM